MEYVKAKLYDAGGDLKKRWYVYYKVKDETGQLVTRHKKTGLNKFKTAAERRIFARDLIKEIDKELEAGKRKGTAKDDFHWWFQQRLDYSKAMHGYYNFRKLQSIHNKLKEFSPILLVSDVTHSFLRKYERWMKTEKSNSPNTIADTMDRIGIVMGEIEKDGYIQYKENPFHSIKFETTRVEKQRLTEEQIERLIHARLESDQQILARDMYLLSYYCAGIRYGDLVRLKPEMFKGGRLKYEMGKTKGKKQQRNILITKPVYNIIAKYKGGEYLFPLKIDWQNEKKSINSSNTLMNKHLKKACFKAIIPELTFHTSRNTFADMAVKKGVGTRQLKELFAHSKESITEIYMKDFYHEQTDEALRTVFKPKKTKK